MADLKSDDPTILEEGDNEESVEPEDEDDMLLLSSPSSSRGDDSTQQKEYPEEERTAEAEQMVSSDKILVEDSESVDEFEKSDNSVEVIDSGESLDEFEEVENVESSSAYLDGKVHIFLVHGALFIWNADDVRMLREECRIIGKLSGCLPRAPRQNSQLGLPLQLMPEEAKLLEEIEAACVVEEVEVNDEDEKLRRAAFEQTRMENFKIQQKLYKESRKEEIAQHMDEIVAGKKKRKLRELAKSEKKQKVTGETSVEADKKDEKKDDGESKIDSGKQDDAEHEKEHKNVAEIDEEEHVKDASVHGNKDVKTEKEPTEKTEKDAEGNSESEDEDIPDVDALITTETDVKHSFVQIFTENPWHRDVRRCRNWVFPLSQKDRLRCAVFRDLWRKGYCLTSGSKFGGDFLVYPGDPARFHSHFIAICVDISEDMSVLDLISMARLASNVRKTALICSFNKFRQISYVSLQWTGMV